MSIRTFDVCALAGLSLVLLIVFYYQLALGEFPCPLCLLQRVGFIVAGIAVILNLTHGARPAHYGLMLLAAVAAGSASLRQISLHVVPNMGAYGSALFGFHFYTWAFVGYGALVTYAGVMLIATRFGDEPRSQLSGAAKLACWIFTALIAANALATLAECGFGACPDDPTGWLWSK
jgi:disulfide bond formation protein DsbB